jgi:hypothetical protein
MEIYAVVGKKSYANLLADPTGADAIIVPCTPGKGSLKAGALLVREASGLYSPAASAGVVDTAMLAVLAEDVDTGDAVASGTTVTAENAKAYRAGCFIDGMVKTSDNVALTAAQKLILRKQGITFDKAQSTETVTNTVTGS